MKLSQTIRFCASKDGTRIAVASCGQGQVILRAAHWLSHVDYDLESPVWRPW
ncbi:helix-turn-helix transcriptional regulator, partial [Rhizobium ruizarguesonis]